MNITQMIKRLKDCGIYFDKGLSRTEIVIIENLCDFKFPTEIKEFLSYAMPIGREFYNYRDTSKSNILKIKDFQKKIINSFLFDIENNHLLAMFKNKFKDCKNDEELKNSVFNYLNNSPKLVPFYGHRCFFSGMDNMPIISFMQPIDSIFYGSNFENYLENEFINKSCNVGKITRNFKKTGIWYDLIW
ncbi:MAG: hypothetical protein IJ458_01585 [Clostridia bacterium]|nr:hypothetical protein [Clostridia bacterium]MBQ8522338.1 hypothetical protein [Clostridia bacterium]